MFSGEPCEQPIIANINYVIKREKRPNFAKKHV